MTPTWRQSAPGRSIGVLLLVLPREALMFEIIDGMGTLAGPFYGTLFDENLVEVFDRDINTPGHDSLTTTVVCSAGRNRDAGNSATRLLTRSCPGVKPFLGRVVFIVFILFVSGGLLGTLRLYVGGKLSHRFGDFLGQLISRGRSRLGR